MKPETASVAQLKSGLSRYLAKARAGQTVEVTSHRKVIARVVGVPDEKTEKLPVGLAKMVAEGKLAPGDGRRLSFRTPVKLSAGGSSVSDIVLDDRGSR